MSIRAITPQLGFFIRVPVIETFVSAAGTRCKMPFPIHYCAVCES